ncbi:endonuclease/exonuclease/phosphatase [Pedobacter sp. HDW13]|uniref:endonuclease/exonuclease/phosphatase family protein n=1 Tax=unclassified Pedobacter TaxID=2628915 RepID=UPI00140E4008|nr:MULTISPECIES: endonuclease/exonuclease/phosphatase family protein [unclassified Pedobacter]QIL38247.1 endonuclease/exonuclease/phosphatase [Pedobacter sp. HDW13]
MKNLYLPFLIVALLFSGCSPKIGAGSAAKSTNRLRVMSYNIHHCNPPTKEKEGTIDVNAIAKAISLQHPDLVALQEVDVNTKRSGNINQAVLLAQKLKMNFYFAKAIDHDGGDYGVAILSRFPLSAQKTYKLPKNNSARAEQRVFAIATVEIANGKFIRFASTHLDAERAEENRIMQVKEIVKLTAAETLPLLIAGDLNAEPGSETIKLFDAAFTRSCGNCGFTIPVINPKTTIDHIAFKKGNPFNVIYHEVVKERYASDHLPILSVIDLKD